MNTSNRVYLRFQLNFQISFLLLLGSAKFMLLFLMDLTYPSSLSGNLIFSAKLISQSARKHQLNDKKREKIK